MNPGLQGVSSQLSPLPTEICELIMSEVIYDSAINMMALRLKLKISIKNDSVTPYILFDKDNSVTPYVFFHDDQ